MGLAGVAPYGPSLLPSPEQAERLARRRLVERRRRVGTLVVGLPLLQVMAAVVVGGVGGWALLLYALAALLLLAVVAQFGWGHLRAIIAQGVIAFPLGFWTCRFSLPWFLLVLALLCLAAVSAVWLRSIQEMH